MFTQGIHKIRAHRITCVNKNVQQDRPSAVAESVLKELDIARTAAPLYQFSHQRVGHLQERNFFGNK